jgi:cytochrome c oxidase cbb3-type subunit 3
MKRFLLHPFPKQLMMGLGLLATPSLLLAGGPPQKDTLENPMAMVLLSVIVALFIVLILLARVLLGTAQFYMRRAKEEANASAKKNSSPAALIILFLCCAGISASAQEAAEAAVPAAGTTYIAGLSESTFVMLISVIMIELIAILWIAFLLKRLLAKEAVLQVSEETAAVAAGPGFLKKWWNRANSFRSVHEEADMDLGHDYDNIRELDNRLPPWWLYGFYLTIIFAVIYLWRFHVSHTAPSSLEEYAAAVQKGEEEKEAYLAGAASKVDENTVQMLDAAGIASGKAIFTSSCAPCHGADGGGVVGPNLTDDYWLHGGSLKAVFKTIKYGVPEKGMKSWKDDFSPVQLAQLASFVKSLHGAKAAAPKEAQGELYKEEPAAADSTQKKPL